MGAKPDERAVLRGATIFIGAAACVILGFRVSRLMAVGLALGLRKRGREEEKQPPA